MLKLIVALAVLACVCATEVRFDGYQVYHLTPKTSSQIQAVIEFGQNDDHIDFDIWREASGIGEPIDIMVSPERKDYFENFLRNNEIEYEIYISNVQELVENGKPKAHAARAFGWTDYYELDEINAWLDQLADEFPDRVSVIVAGSSYEGRDVRGVKVSFSSANANNSVVIEGGIHSREWVSPATVTYIINELLTSSDETVRAVAERYDWYIIPVFNPDGYVFTHTSNRMWRKTRVPYGNCFGADPNRNWGYRWNTGGSSNNPCSDTYAGPYAFSEPSVESTSRYLSSIQSQVIAYISFHSFSQMLMFPFGHTTDHLDNHDELNEVCLKSIDALAQRYGTQYVCGNIAETIYVATGSSLDWMKGVYGTRIAYVYELRDLGRFGFLLPAEQIIPTSEETVDSLVTILEEFNRL